MARGSHWWNEPPLWAWIVMVVSAVAFAVMLPFALDRQTPTRDVGTAPGTGPAEPSGSGEPDASADASAAASPTTSAAPDELDLVAVGDGYTSGTAQGGVGPQGWPELLRVRLEAASVEVAADVGAGFLAPGVGGSTLAELAAGVDVAGADLVVVFGSRDDGAGVADDVRGAAQDLFEQVRVQAPEAALVVIGPAFPVPPGPAPLRANRDAVREAAAAVDATWVDPLALGWFDDAPQVLGTDGLYPTDEGHVYLSDRIEPFVRDALGLPEQP